MRQAGLGRDGGQASEGFSAPLPPSLSGLSVHMLCFLVFGFYCFPSGHSGISAPSALFLHGASLGCAQRAGLPNSPLLMASVSGPQLHIPGMEGPPAPRLWPVVRPQDAQSCPSPARMRWQGQEQGRSSPGVNARSQLGSESHSLVECSSLMGLCHGQDAPHRGP